MKNCDELELTIHVFRVLFRLFVFSKDGLGAMFAIKCKSRGVNIIIEMVSLVYELEVTEG